MTEPAPDRTGDGAGPPGPNGSSNRDQGMRILSYLMAGIGLYGGLGWLLDRWLRTDFGLPGGLLAGMGISLYVIIKQFGSDA